VRHWLQRYDRWQDDLLEKATSAKANRRGHRLAFPFPFPSRNYPQSEPITCGSLMRHALIFSLLFVFVYNFIIVVGIVLTIFYLIVTHYPHASYHGQAKGALILLKLLVKHSHQQIISSIWGQIGVALILTAFAILLNDGTLRAWNRRANCLRMNPDITVSQSDLTSEVWPPPPTSR
jgi:hypothetical protein